MWFFILMLVALQLKTLSTSEDDTIELGEIMNGANEFIKYHNTVFEDYSFFLVNFCINLMYCLYNRLTFINVVIFLFKYVPTALYLYKFMKDVYLTSRKRIKEKQMEIDNVQFQLDIINKKLIIRHAEFKEQAVHVRMGIERLRRVRERVRAVIASDETLRRTLPPDWNFEKLHQAEESSEDREYLVDLLKELNHDYISIPVGITVKPNNMEADKHDDEKDPNINLDDGDRQDCRVKIVKVTNVYKVAYLKHYIKQKKLRRANKHAQLRQKMESIKQLLEDWQKTLNMVINRKFTILNIDPQSIQVASEEETAEYNKPQDSSDTDSTLENSSPDVNYDGYKINWTAHQYEPYFYNNEDATPRQYYQGTDYIEYIDLNADPDGQNRYQYNNMSLIAEETISQMAIEDINFATADDSNNQITNDECKGEYQDDSRDLIAL